MARRDDSELPTVRPLAPDEGTGLEPPTRDPGRRSPTTTAAGLLALVVPAPFIAAGWSLLTAGIGGEGSPGLERLGSFAVGGLLDGGWLVATGFLVLALSLLAVVLGLGILARRTWARESGLLMFTFFGAIVTLLSLAGLGSDAPNAGVGLLDGLVQLAVAVLLFVPSTAEDVEHAEWRRARRDA